MYYFYDNETKRINGKSNVNNEESTGIFLETDYEFTNENGNAYIVETETEWGKTYSVEYRADENFVQAEKQRQINVLKANLQSTDYLAIKFFEGYLTEEEFAPIKQQRQSWRDEINALQEEGV